MQRRLFLSAAFAAGILAVAPAARAADTVKIADVIELSGAGAPVGTNWRDAVNLAVDEINAKGGILGKKIELSTYDTRTDPTTSRAMVQKAISDGAYVILGPIYSGSVKVNMLVAKQNGVPQFTGAEAPDITKLGNPYIFTTSFGADKSMPLTAKMVADQLHAKTVAVTWVNDDFGKGGRDAFVKAVKADGVKVVADIPSEVGQADFAADVSKIKESKPDAVFAYLHEEESARLLKEIRKQGIKAAIVGETTLLNQKTLSLAGSAANGVIGHVNLSADAPVPGIKEFAKKFQAKYHYTPDHNAIKAYLATYVVKYVTEKVGSFDRQKFADTLHGLTITTKEEPGVLMTTRWLKDGSCDRESFMAKVVDGKQVIVKTLPPLGE